MSVHVFTKCRTKGSELFSCSFPPRIMNRSFSIGWNSDSGMCTMNADSSWNAESMVDRSETSFWKMPRMGVTPPLSGEDSCRGALVMYACKARGECA